MNPDNEIRAFLAGKTPFFETETRWAEGTLPLRVRYYRSDERPPEQLVTSVRCLVLKDDSVLVLRNREGYHILPGGRLEAGETFERALHREVAEETGWTIETVSRLGFIHLKHLEPKPTGYRFPHPHFFQLVYAARASEHVPDSMRDDDYEASAAFVPIGDLESLGISEAELGFVKFIGEGT
ncbi:MAG: NUDIX hydrolase [Gemmatimonadota bacterium]|nr:NUDIX hydrolase [Gemmatimonadota bacterium]